MSEDIKFKVFYFVCILIKKKLLKNNKRIYWTNKNSKTNWINRKKKNNMNFKWQLRKENKNK